MGFNQSAELNFFINPESKSSSMTIEYINADSKYLYLPYETKSIDSAGIMEINGDYYKRISSDINKFTITTSSTLYQKLVSLREGKENKLYGTAYEKMIFPNYQGGNLYA